MKTDTQFTRKKLSLLTRNAYLLGALFTCAILSSCAYTETMNERNTEGYRLQHELDQEVDRGNRLSR